MITKIEYRAGPISCANQGTSTSGIATPPRSWSGKLFRRGLRGAPVNSGAHQRRRLIVNKSFLKMTKTKSQSRVDSTGRQKIARQVNTKLSKYSRLERDGGTRCIGIQTVSDVSTSLQHIYAWSELYISPGSSQAEQY